MLVFVVRLIALVVRSAFLLVRGRSVSAVVPQWNVPLLLNVRRSLTSVSVVAVSGVSKIWPAICFPASRPLVGHHVAFHGSAFQGPRCVRVCVCVCVGVWVCGCVGVWVCVHVHVYMGYSDWAVACSFVNYSFERDKHELLSWHTNGQCEECAIQMVTLTAKPLKYFIFKQHSLTLVWSGVASFWGQGEVEYSLWSGMFREGPQHAQGWKKDSQTSDVVWPKQSYVPWQKDLVWLHEVLDVKYCLTETQLL